VYGLQKSEKAVPLGNLEFAPGSPQDEVVGRYAGLMVTLSTDVLVIGGGATGVGIAWDGALRGLEVILVDRRDLAEGTSGRFHGLLHSGSASPRTGSCAGSRPTASRTPAGCS
jgi:hypothetical protein